MATRTAICGVTCKFWPLSGHHRVDQTLCSGIVLAFWVFFVGWYLAATERAGNISASATQLVFKQNAQIPDLGEHEDKDNAESGATLPDVAAIERDQKATQAAQNASSKSRAVFSWYHMNYDVTVSGGKQRRLLNDVSGFVAPGKMVSTMV